MTVSENMCLLYFSVHVASDTAYRCNNSLISKRRILCHQLLCKYLSYFIYFYLYKLTHFRLNKHSSHYILQESNFKFRFVRLCDLDIP